VGIGRFAYTPLLPPMQEALGWTLTQAGDVASANFLGYMIGALTASVLTQRRERRLWLLAGMLLSAATTGAGALVVSFLAWLGLRFVSGVASAFCLVLGTAVVIELLTRYARLQLGALHFSGVGGGMVASVLVIECLRRTGASIFCQWALLGMTSITLLAGAWMLLRAFPDPVVWRPSRTSYACQETRSGTPGLKKLIIAYGMFGFGYIVTATFIVAMARRLDQAARIESLTWIVVGAMAAPSVFAWQRLARRLGTFSTLRLAYGLEATGVVLAGYGTGYVALITGGALLGVTFMGITALGLMAARQVTHDNPDRVMGWMTASFGLGQLLGPAVAGRLAQMTQGFEVPSMVAAILLIAGMGLLRHREPHPSPCA
jgi:predicted MFS family arabinose efflux permease